MASNHLIVVVSSLLILSLAFPFIAAASDEKIRKTEKKVDVVVEGMVYCQSCKYHGSWSLSEAEPIPSAKVSVICKNHKNQVSYYKAFETNGKGYYYAQLDGFKMSHDLLEHPLQSCQVKLVSSPLEKCNLLSNVNDGMYGTQFRYKNKLTQGKNYEAVIYTALPLAFRPAQCPMAPTTTHF